MRILMAAVLSAALILSASLVHAQGYKNPGGRLAGQIGLGFAFGPGDSAISMAAEGEYYITDNLSLVPRFTLDMQDRARLYTFTGDLRLTVALSRLQLFGEGGAGVAIGEADGFRNDTALQIEGGGGANLFFTDNAAIGTEALVAFPLGFHRYGFYRNDVILQWQIVTIKYIF